MSKKKSDEASINAKLGDEIRKVKIYRTTEERVSDLSKQCTTISTYDDVRALGLGREFRAIADALEVLQMKVQEGTKNGASAQTSILG